MNRAWGLLLLLPLIGWTRHDMKAQINVKEVVAHLSAVSTVRALMLDDGTTGWTQKAYLTSGPQSVQFFSTRTLTTIEKAGLLALCTTYTTP